MQVQIQKQIEEHKDLLGWDILELVEKEEKTRPAFNSNKEVGVVSESKFVNEPFVESGLLLCFASCFQMLLREKIRVSGFG